MAQPTPYFWTSSLQNCETRNLYLKLLTLWYFIVTVLRSRTKPKYIAREKKKKNYHDLEEPLYCQNYTTSYSDIILNDISRMMHRGAREQVHKPLWKMVSTFNYCTGECLEKNILNCNKIQVCKKLQQNPQMIDSLQFSDVW